MIVQLYLSTRANYASRFRNLTHAAFLFLDFETKGHTRHSAQLSTLAHIRFRCSCRTHISHHLTH